MSEHGRCLLRGMYPDIAFISCNSWDLERGVTSLTEEKTTLKQELMANSSRRVLLADSSKYGSWSVFSVAPLSAFTDIITDKNLNAETQGTLFCTHTGTLIMPSIS
ncbi:hypothetical protein [Klebsiella aerogenes]|uniref:hypothetical protein n=1 Tax=Klebsiella aerogenes TaxID=548 RepID=UPI0039C8B9E3